MNVPINKGNYNMDTDERIKAYGEKLAEGWEEAYRKYRSDWVENAQKRIVSDYPLLLDIETSSVCNLKCSMCFSGTEEYKKLVKPTMLKMQLFEKIMNEVAGKIPALRLSWRGEPTLHPGLRQMIRLAKKSGFGEVSFLTNGSKLSGEYVDELVSAGLDWITISIDGMGSVYENIRKPMKFDDVLRNVKNLAGAKKKAWIKQAGCQSSGNLAVNTQ